MNLSITNKILRLAAVGIFAGTSLTHAALTINVDVDHGTTYSGTALAPDSGTVWNGLSISDNPVSRTISDIKDSLGNTLSGVDVTMASSDGTSSINRYATDNNTTPNPQDLMRDYSYNGTYGITVSGLDVGSYDFWYFGHGDKTDQAGIVTVDAANGGGGGNTADSLLGRDLVNGGDGISYVYVSGVTVDGTGVFSFQVSNFINGFQLQLLSVSDAPPVITGLTDQTVVVGESIVLSPTITGNPAPSYQWRSNEVAIAGSTNATLSLNNIQYAQNGTVYSLVATNEVGAATNSMTLTVLTEPVVAFPGAEGAGANALGGRGGDVYYVTTLADNNSPGSFRYGISTTPASGRTICFKVSGNIVLNSKLSLNRNRITVAGQTAPGDGICLQNYSFNIEASDIIVRHLRTRLGTDAMQEADCMWISSGSNIIVDHLSASWSVDEVLSATRDVANLTVQNCFITEALNNSIHVKDSHGYGGIVSSAHWTTYSYMRNLYAHNRSRNPRIGSDKAAANTLRLDFKNNVIYNYGDRAGYTGGPEEFCELNYIGNYCIKGPSSTYNYILASGDYTTSIYQEGNYNDINRNGLVDGSNTGWGMFSGPYTAYTSAFAVPVTTTESAPAAYQRVVALSGAMPWRRDSTDRRVAGTVRQQNGTLIDAVSEVGGWSTLNSETAPLDTDSDGMPDYWEEAVSLNPAYAADRNNIDVSGYTELEVYLSWLADAHALCDRNGHVDVDLRAATGGATNLTYSVASDLNGTVSLLGDGHTARFFAAANTNGVANFTFTATDPVAAVSFGPINYGLLITTTNAPVYAAPILTVSTNVPGGAFEMLINGDSGPDYIVQASTNMTNWTDVFTNTGPVPPFPWTDTEATNYQQRFYRVLLGP